MKPNLQVALTMHKGRSRHQQDAILTPGRALQLIDSHIQLFEAEADALFAIADGVAASPTAARASVLAVKALAKAVKEHLEWSFDGLVGARHVRAAQQQLSGALASGWLKHGASTTLVGAHIRGNQLAVVNSGDSRAYLFRHEGDIECLSRDHTQRRCLLDEGFAVDGVEYASIYDALSDCLVADPEAADFAVHRQTTTLRPGDRLLLCSDGVHDVLDGSAWLTDIAQQRSPSDLVGGTRSLVLKNGAPDNFSMIAIRFLGRP